MGIFDLKLKKGVAGTANYKSRGRENAVPSEFPNSSSDNNQSKTQERKMIQIHRDSNSVKITMKYNFTFIRLIDGERIYGYQSKTEKDYDRFIYYKMADIIEYFMSHSHKCRCNYCSEILEMVNKIGETPQTVIRTPTNTSRPPSDLESLESTSSRQPLRSQEETFTRFLQPILDQQKRNLERQQEINKKVEEIKERSPCIFEGNRDPRL